MNGNSTERWVSVSALGAAMFAVGLSLAAVACGTKDVSVAEVARAAVSANTLPAPATSLGSEARVVNGVPTSPLAVPATPVSASVSDGLKLKRFVVTHKIENHEPGPGDDFTLGGAPVYAFVEFENLAHDARSVRVVFQNEDTKASVGHVKLSVPGGQARFRTWGNTRTIRDPGHWVAVVSTLDGVELGRAPFEVKS